MTIAIYTPSSRTFLGVLILNIDKKFLSQSLTNYSFYGTGNTIILSNENVLQVLNPNINAPVFNYRSGMKEHIFGHEEGEFKQNHNGINVYISFEKITGAEIYVAHLVDLDTLLLPTKEILNKCIFYVGVLTIVCIALAHFATLSISSPLKSLMKGIKKFGEGNEIYRCDTSGKDELTYLNIQFNQMVNNNIILTKTIIESKTKQDRLELSKTTAELNALQMQINPHFLYNTLDLIRWETIRVGQGESDASRMIDSFCKLMRMSVKNGESSIAVTTELEHALAYVDIANLRNKVKIKVENHIEFDTNTFFLPKLTLQPLIENSIVHGFGTSFQDPTIVIRGWKIKKLLMITITDNGKGIPLKKLNELRNSFLGTEIITNSLGLRNVNQRFMLLFGSEYGVTIESVENMGTEITIRLPI